MSKITLDREAFKVLAADTRIDMLKHISQHKLTLSDLSQKMGLSPSTVKEHLDKLCEAKLIEQIESDTKWKYYRLTWKGENIVNSNGANIWIVLSTTLFGLIASAAVLGKNISPYFMRYFTQPTPPSSVSDATYSKSENLAESAAPQVNALMDSASQSATDLLLGEAPEELSHGLVDAATRTAKPTAGEMKYASQALDSYNETVDVFTDSLNRSVVVVKDSLNESLPQIIPSNSCVWSIWDFVLDPINIVAVFIFSVCMGILLVYGSSIIRRIRIQIK